MIFSTLFSNDLHEQLAEHLHHLFFSKVDEPESKHSREFGGLLPRSECTLPQGAAN